MCPSLVSMRPGWPHVATRRLSPRAGTRHGTGPFGSSFTSGSLGHHYDPVWDPSFSGFWKMSKMQNVHLKCWNEKSHCQVSVVGLKSLDVSPCNELLRLPMIIKKFLAWGYFFTHKSTFGVHYRTGSTGSAGRWIPGSLGQKCDPVPSLAGTPIAYVRLRMFC